MDFNTNGRARQTLGSQDWLVRTLMIYKHTVDLINILNLINNMEIVVFLETVKLDTSIFHPMVSLQK